MLIDIFVLPHFSHIIIWSLSYPQRKNSLIFGDIKKYNDIDDIYELTVDGIYLYDYDTGDVLSGSLFSEELPLKFKLKKKSK